jgi:hypothetical protein
MRVPMTLKSVKNRGKISSKFPPDNGLGNRWVHCLRAFIGHGDILEVLSVAAIVRYHQTRRLKTAWPSMLSATATCRQALPAQREYARD